MEMVTKQGYNTGNHKHEEREAGSPSLSQIVYSPLFTLGESETSYCWKSLPVGTLRINCGSDKGNVLQPPIGQTSSCQDLSEHAINKPEQEWTIFTVFSLDLNKRTPLVASKWRTGRTMTSNSRSIAGAANKVRMRVFKMVVHASSIASRAP